jgi:hypothetical protein
MNFNPDIDPIGRLRIEAANRAKTERQELLDAYRQAVAEDIRMTENQREELEQKVAQHSAWVGKNLARIEALLPRNLASLSVYESKLGLYRSQFDAALSEAKRTSVNSLWGNRSDGQRDPAVYKAVVSGIMIRLGCCRGLCGALDACFRAIGVELAALERHGFGLAPNTAPLVEYPAQAESLVVITNDPELKPHSKKR